MRKMKQAGTALTTALTAALVGLLGVGSVSSQVIVGSQDFSIVVDRAPDICDDQATAIGATCSDGAIYAGLHNGNRIFVAPSGEGARQWKTTATYTPGTYGDDGFMNSESIRQVGLNVHPAANACAAKGADWYLPSVAEWQSIHANLTGASVNLSSIFPTTSLHWSSESWGTGKAGTTQEDSVSFAYSFRPSDAAFFVRSRTSTTSSALAHCVRHDGSRAYQDPCASGAPAVGTYCQSGAVYAGNGLFVAPDRTVATQWKTSRTITAGTQSETDGFENTQAIEAAGLSAHPVANACRAMGADWYLPANGEIGTLFTNFGSAPRALRHAFIVDFARYHWSSTEVSTDTTRAKIQAPDGTVAQSLKDSTTAYAVRCMFNPGDAFIPEDLMPDAFVLSSNQNVSTSERDVLVTFNPATISGINQPVTVSVVGDGSPQLSINGGAWVTSGTVSEGDQVAVRITSGPTLNVTRSATLTVGQLSVGFGVTTRQASDFTPDVFAFGDLVNQPTDATVTSLPVTPTGYEQMVVTPPAGVLVSVSGGSFSSGSQVVNAGDSLTAQLSTGSFAPRTFSSDIVFKNTSGVETFRTTWSVSVIQLPGDVADTFAFNWEYFPQTYFGTFPGSIYQSEIITLSGGTGTRPLRVLETSGHYNSGTLNRWPRIYGSRIYYKNTGTTITTSLTDDANAVMWSTANTNHPNIVTDMTRTLRLKYTPANQSSETYSVFCVASTCAEHIWTNSATRSDPRAANAFDIVDITGAELNTQYTSDPFIVSWSPRTASVMPPNIPISISGTGSPQYRIDGGAWTNVSGWVRSGSTIEVQQTSASTDSTDRVATLSVGTTTSNYVVRTPDDTTADAFSLATTTGAEPNSLSVSGAVTITGISTTVSVSVSGEGSPQLSVNGGDWVTEATVGPNGQVRVRLTTASAYEASRTATLDVNGVTASFTATTAPFTFTIASVSNVALNTVVTSDPVTMPVFLTASSISVTGAGAPSYSLNGGAFTTQTGTITAGDVLRVRQTSAGAKDTDRVATVTIGAASAEFVAHTLPPEVCETGAVGSVCSDGAIYAGVANGNKIFVAPASEAGTYAYMTSNNATLGAKTQDGLVNAWAVQVAGISQFPSAQVCAARGEEWVLPSEAEMTVMRNNRASMPAGTFSYASAWYWTSTEYDSLVGYANTSYLSSASTSYAQKTTSNRAHCLRYSREAPRPAVTDPCAGTPSIGALCGDGSVYAGLSDGKRIFFETRHSATVAHKTTETFTAGSMSLTSAIQNRHAMTINGGLAVHPAQNICAAKGSSSSGSLWYLPARNDLSVLNTNRDQGVLAQMFNSSATGYIPASIWSSTQSLTSASQSTYMQKGGSFIDTSSKTTTSTAAVLCVRFDSPQTYIDPCAGSPTAGALCEDGSVFASTFDGRQLRVRAVSGIHSLKSANTNTIGAVSTDGFTNSGAILVAGSSNAVQQCRSLGAQYSLPSIEEITTIRAISLGVSPINTYVWTSSDAGGGNGRISHTNGTTQTTATKTSNYNVMCVSYGAEPREAENPCLAATPVAGSLCADGTVYVGKVDGRRIYTSTADIGVTRRINSVTTAIPGTTSLTDGKANTDAMVGVNMEAANACRALGTRWYLPARDELTALRSVTTGTLNLSQTISGSTWYWSSSQSSTTNNHTAYLSATSVSTASRTTANRVRCVYSDVTAGY